ncbi:MAG: Minf_1886 family protein [Thermoguttaceae bacterium]
MKHDPMQSMAELLRQDRRYKLDAYIFVFEALNYAQNVLGLGRDCPSETNATGEEEADEGPQRHVTGQQLCEAVREYGLEQYGYMAKTVLNSWGIRATADVGEIVFNLIRVGRMRKTKDDTREDFENVYDFDAAFRDYKFTALP